ncbi:MAG: biotin/lipoyl-containing protein [archaeon]
MVHEVILPKLEANMTDGSITEWLKQEGQPVKKGEPLFMMETVKSVFEVESEADGILLKRLAPENQAIPAASVVALIGQKGEAVDTAKYRPTELAAPEQRVRASPAAKRLAREKGIDLNDMQKGGIIQQSDVAEAISKPGKRRILILGAGNGGEVVSDILNSNPENEIIGFLDDTQDGELVGRSIIGPIAIVDDLAKKKAFDYLIISITSNMELRKDLFQQLKLKGYGFINAIHTRAYVNKTAKLGVGNIICANVHVGYGASIGDNNLISAQSSIEHHNKIGSHILFGPCCATSGDVTIGDNCTLGTGIFIEPHVTVGENSKIASGSIIIADVQQNQIIKARRK